MNSCRPDEVIEMFESCLTWKYKRGSILHMEHDISYVHVCLTTYDVSSVIHTHLGGIKQL